MRRVVITGVGALSPCGSTAGATWDAMVAGRSGIDVLKNVPVDGLPVRIGGEVKDFDANEALGRRLAKRMDRFCQFGVVAGEEAWRDAGLENFDGDSTRMGVYIGTGVGGLGRSSTLRRALMPVDLADSLLSSCCVP